MAPRGTSRPANKTMRLNAQTAVIESGYGLIQNLVKVRIRSRFAPDSPLEEAGFEPVWGFSCQVVVFGFLPVLCSERESRSSSRRLRSGSRSARKGSRDRNGSTAWRLAALAALVFRSALTPEHAERR